MKRLLIASAVAWTVLIMQPADALMVNVGKPVAKPGVSVGVGSLRQWRTLAARGLSLGDCTQCQSIIKTAVRHRGDIRELLAAVNNAVNRARYVADADNWREQDFWATPRDLFQRGGDCEDYAIAKMLMLRSLGVKSSAMKILVYPATANADAHALLSVETPGGTLVLDNRRSGVHKISSREASRYTFGFNDQRVWLNAGL